MQLQQLILMKRMAWMANKKATRKSTEEENRRLKPYAISTMVYVATLNSFLYDLYDAVEADLPNPQVELPMIARIRSDATYAHNALFKLFDKSIDRFGYYYNAEMERAVEAINKNVLIPGGSKLYNIVLALLRITKDYNEKCGRWKCPAICDLYKAERRLKTLKLPYEDKSQVVEMIIRNAVKINIPDD